MRSLTLTSRFRSSTGQGVGPLLSRRTDKRATGSQLR